MPPKTISILKSFFENGDRPTESQFIDLIDSFIHKTTGSVVTARSYDESTGQVTISFSNSLSPLTFNVSKSEGEEISFINGLQDALNEKVLKETGKELSSNDFTNELKTKLENLQQVVLPTSRQISFIEGLTQALDEKANDDEVVKSVTFNGTNHTPDENGNVALNIDGVFNLFSKKIIGLDLNDGDTIDPELPVGSTIFQKIMRGLESTFETKVIEFGVRSEADPNNAGMYRVFLSDVRSQSDNAIKFSFKGFFQIFDHNTQSTINTSNEVDFTGTEVLIFDNMDAANNDNSAFALMIASIPEVKLGSDIIALDQNDPQQFLNVFIGSFQGETLHFDMVGSYQEETVGSDIVSVVKLPDASDSANNVIIDSGNDGLNTSELFIVYF